MVDVFFGDERLGVVFDEAVHARIVVQVVLLAVICLHYGVVVDAQIYPLVTMGTFFIRCVHGIPHHMTWNRPVLCRGARSQTAYTSYRTRGTVSLEYLYPFAVPSLVLIS